MERMLRKRSLVVTCLSLGLTLSFFSVEAARTHEAFSQTTYYETPSSTKFTELPPDVETLIPVKEDSSFPGAERKAESLIPGVFESKEESTRDLVPREAKPDEIPVVDRNAPQRFTQHRGAYTTTGDFTADARPWWFNPQYANYGNTPLGRQPTTGYPGSFDTRYYDSQYNEKENQVQPSNYYQYNGVNSNIGAGSSELNSGGCPTQYWIANTHRWPAFFNVKSTMGDAFGTPATNVFGDTTVLQALLNRRTDGYSSLMRNGATAILNAYSRSEYKFPHQKVIESFNAALVSRQAAARQAAMFDEANMSAFTEQYNSCS